MSSQSAATNSSVKVFFEPESVAIVGAARTPGRPGHIILQNLIRLKFQGKIFPVNPNATEIAGIKAYPTVAAIPDKVDLAVIAVPPLAVLDVVRDCATKGVKGLVIISAGFNEVGPEGIKRQSELIRIARRAGMRVVGPNTTGVVNSHNHFATTFLELDSVKEGSIGFIAQTGLFAALTLQHIMTAENFGVSKVAGLGNKSDVADHEILDYLSHDDATKAIMMYIEGIKEGRLFFEAARRLTKQKPIIVLKIGRTPAGAKVALSHTASLTGSDEVFEAMCHQAGIIRANDFDELIDFAKMFAFQPIPRGNRIAIVSVSGGAAALASDFSFLNGLRIADIKASTLDMVKEKSPAWAQVSNPVDIEPLLEVVGPKESYRIAFDAVLDDENVDMCLVVLTTLLKPELGLGFLEEIKKKHPEKPVAACVLGSKDLYEQLYKVLEGYQIPVFPSPRRAIMGLATLYRYAQLNR